MGCAHEVPPALPAPPSPPPSPPSPPPRGEASARPLASDARRSRARRAALAAFRAALAAFPSRLGRFPSRRPPNALRPASSSRPYRPTMSRRLACCRLRPSRDLRPPSLRRPRRLLRYRRRPPTPHGFATVRRRYSPRATRSPYPTRRSPVRRRLCARGGETTRHETETEGGDPSAASTPCITIGYRIPRRTPAEPTVRRKPHTLVERMQPAFTNRDNARARRGETRRLGRRTLFAAPRCDEGDALRIEIDIGLQHRPLVRPEKQPACARLALHSPANGALDHALGRLSRRARGRRLVEPFFGRIEPRP